MIINTFLYYICFFFLHIKRIIYTSSCMCVHAHSCGQAYIWQLYHDWCVSRVTRYQEENLSLELHFKQYHFHLLLPNFILKEVFNICLLKQPLEASTSPAICKLYNVQHEQTLKYRGVNTLYLASGTTQAWLTLCSKPISYSFRNKTGWTWNCCLKLSNTPQWWWCRQNLESHKKETSWFLHLKTSLLFIFWSSEYE